MASNPAVAMEVSDNLLNVLLLFMWQVKPVDVGGKMAVYPNGKQFLPVDDKLDVLWKFACDAVRHITFKELSQPQAVPGSKHQHVHP